MSTSSAHAGHNAAARTRPTRPASDRSHGTHQRLFTPLADEIRSAGLLRRRYGYYWTLLIGLPLAVIATLVAFVLFGGEPCAPSDEELSDVAAASIPRPYSSAHA